MSPESLCLLIFEYGTSCDTLLGKNTPKNVYMHLIIERGVTEKTPHHICSLTRDEAFPFPTDVTQRKAVKYGIVLYRPPLQTKI